MTVILIALFWFTSRYPQLLHKAHVIGKVLPSMAWGSEVVHVSMSAPLWKRVLFGAINWLDGMKIGMSFGVLLGALLHTILKYHPLKIGNNLTLNSLKGALIGVPMGVCANCAVPTACGVTRGNGRVEVALGFLFSSPNFNPVVIMMTFSALPLGMAVTKYVLLLGVILFIVPGLVKLLERKKPMKILTSFDAEDSCAIPMSQRCDEPFLKVFSSLMKEFGSNVWMLLKPTIKIMLIGSVVASAMLVLLPWQSMLAHPNPLTMLFVSVLAVFMPTPIALDVMFAAQLHHQGVSNGYVMMFLMTLGTFSIIPSIYLWKEVSKPLAAILFGIFVIIGFVTGLVFGMWH